MQQAVDLRAEGDALATFLDTLEAADWQRVTLFKGWTVDDVIRHIHLGDRMAILSVTDPAAYETTRLAVMAKRAAGRSRVSEAKEALDGLSGAALSRQWHATLHRLCDLLAATDPGARLPWGGREMGARSFTSARQMEAWAHGQAIYDVMGRDREPTDRLKNVATLGIRTFGWTFANRGLPVPPMMPHVRLTAPSGAVWTWNPPDAANAVTGEALHFCQVVAQTRNVADTTLAVTGETAGRWMAMAQCFAGPPEAPPAPGARHRAAPGRI